MRIFGVGPGACKSMTYMGLAASPPFGIKGVPSSAEILDHIISSVFVADPKGRLIYANAALRERSGLVDSEIGEETDDGQPLPRSLTAFRHAYRRAKAAGAPHRFDDVRVTRLDGQERLYAGWMIPLVADGKHTGMLCTAEDVTELREREEELHQFEDRLGTLVNVVPGLVWVTDPETARVRAISQRAEDILGYPVAEWLEPGFFFEHVHPDDRERMAAFVRTLAADGASKEVEYRMIAADGRVRRLHGHASVFREAGKTWMHGATFDVTEARVAEEELRRTTEMLRAIFEQSAIGIIVRDADGNLIEKNAAFDDTCDECSEDVQRRLRPQLERLMKGEIGEIDCEMRCLAGRWYRVRASRVIVDRGEPAVSVTTIENITDRKRAEEQLRGSRDMLGEFVALTTDWVWECDTKARYTWASGRVRDVLGYEPEEVVGKTACDLAPPEEVARVRELLLPLVHAPRAFSMIELIGQHRDGHHVWLEVSGMPLFDDHGAFTGYRGVVRDVTEREANRRERHLLATAIRHAGDIVVITDRDGNIEYVNPAFEDASGYRRDEVLGKTPRILKSGHQPDDFYAELWSELTAGRNWLGSFINRRRDGQTYNVDATISPIFNDRHAITGYVAVERDVTHTLALIESLRSAIEMERFGRLVGAVAHEVRNPLNAIQAAAAALELDFGDHPDARPLFEIVRSQVGRLAQLMRDLLIIGRPISEAALQPHFISSIVTEAIDLWSAAHPDVGAHRLKFRAECDCVIQADPLRLHQVILNLLDNALQHSRGESDIFVRLQQSGDSCSLTISDRGDGVKPENLAKIFEPFFTTRRSGTGLGLALAKSIVEQHGGTVKLANNAPLPGCTVTITIPIAEGGASCSRKS